MERIVSLLPSMPRWLEMVQGDCAVHGAATVLQRRGLPWQCPGCLETSLAEERQASWMRARHASLHAAAAIPPKYLGRSFLASSAEQREARGTVRAFRDFILREAQWAALVLTGECGTGKTLLACEFAESLLRNTARSVRYVTAKGMIAEVQASYGRDGKSEDGEIARFVQPDLLILDEIDALPARENAMLLLTEIVNRRYNDNKPVIAISNQPLAELARHVGDRVFSRLHENAFVCAFAWNDARREQASGQQTPTHF